MPDLISQINPVYFWDVKIDKLDENNAKRLIIERIASLGNMNEIKLMMKHYGHEEIKNILCSLNYLDPKTLNLFSIILHQPKTHFKCYTRKLSHPQHWDY